MRRLFVRAPRYISNYWSKASRTKMLHVSFEMVCKVILKGYCRLEVNQIELPPGPFIICSNHASHLDSPVLMLALGRSFRDFSMLAARDHFQPTLEKKTLMQKLLNLILVDRKASSMETRRLIKECEEATIQKKNLIIYPEGTRSLDGKVRPFKQGSVYIAHKLNLPIVPAAITGSHLALKKNSWLIRPKKIKVHFGEPILPRAFPDKNKKEILQELTQELESKISNLIKKTQADHLT